jgi:hypothetical protein
LSITIGHVRTLHPWIAKSWVLIRGLSGRSRSLPARKLCNDAPTAERILLDGARVSKSLVSFSRRALLYPKAIATLRAMYGRNSSIRTKLVLLADPLVTINREYCLDSNQQPVSDSSEYSGTARPELRA